MKEERPEPDLEALIRQIVSQRGISCDSYKTGCLKRRLAVRMRARGADSYHAYARLLADDPSEYELLLDALTINVTRFYRNPETWDALSRQVLPKLLSAGAGRSSSLRCWSAGCASGEEPYTLAMLVLEQSQAGGDGFTPTVLVDATDLDRESLKRAEEGSYDRSSLDGMPLPLVERYFEPGPEARVTQVVRRLVRFLRHDILRDPPPAPGPVYDLILCRNVAIYFDRSGQELVFQKLVEALAPGGYLVLGKVETVYGDAGRLLVLEDVRERLYRRL